MAGWVMCCRYFIITMFTNGNISKVHISWLVFGVWLKTWTKHTNQIYSSHRGRISAFDYCVKVSIFWYSGKIPNSARQQTNEQLKNPDSCQTNADEHLSNDIVKNHSRMLVTSWMTDIKRVDFPT